MSWMEMIFGKVEKRMYKLNQIIQYKNVYLVVVDECNMCGGCYYDGFDDNNECINNDKFICTRSDRYDKKNVIFKLYPLQEIRKDKLKKLGFL